MAPNESLAPEKRLLVCAARTRIPPLVAQEIRRLIGSPIDWDLLFREAANHAVTPLVCRQIPLVASDLLDSLRVQRLNEISRSFALRNLALTAELFRVVNELRSQGIQAIPYKGPVLAAQAYQDLAVREFADLDIVLGERDIGRANEVMISLGYGPKFPWIFAANRSVWFAPGEYEYHHGARRILVELHTERTLRHFPRPADIDDLITRLRVTCVGDQKLVTFSSEDTLLLLSLHGSKHFWRQLLWIADISEFAQSHPDLDWDQVWTRACAMRLNRMLAISLGLAHRLFSPPLPGEVLRRIQSDAEAGLIAEQIEHGFFLRTPHEPGALARFHLRRHMVEDWLSGWRYSLRLATLPSDEDWSAMRLPALLAPLAAVLRPFRLLRKYGATGASSSHESTAGKGASN